MSDYIDRGQAIRAVCEHGVELERRGIYVLSVANYKQAIVDLLEALPSAEPEREVYSNMSDKEFEEWLYEHGICHPDINESIPCTVVPLLIDNAINELLPAERTGHWIPVSEKLPSVGNYLVTCYDSFYENFTVSIMYFDGEHFSSDDFHEIWLGAVLAWMPLPEPYWGGC